MLSKDQQPSAQENKVNKKKIQLILDYLHGMERLILLREGLLSLLMLILIDLKNQVSLKTLRLKKILKQC